MTAPAVICDWCDRAHDCCTNPDCHRLNEHDGRCNTFDPDGHP